MDKLKLIEVDIEERRFDYNTDLARFFTVLAVLAASLPFSISANITDKFLVFSITFFYLIVIIVLFTSLKRVLKNRREIRKLFDEKRNIINKLN